VLLYGYATGTRSSRRLEQQCRESLPFLFLTRGDTPSYRTLCTARKTLEKELELVWQGLFEVAATHGMRRVGCLVLDSSRWRADAGKEATLEKDEYAAVLAEFRRVLAEAEAADREEEAQGARSETTLETEVSPEQVREILRRVRRKRTGSSRRGGDSVAAAPPAEEPPAEEPPAEEPPAEEPPAAEPPAAATETPRGEEGDSPTFEGTEKETGATGARPRITAKMRQRLEQLIPVLEEALASERKHVNLTDPDAAFMPLGSEKRLGMGHSFEAVVDGKLLVVGQRGDGSTDNARLEPLLEAAATREPDGIHQVTGDSGFYRGEVIGKQLAAGVDVCIPDSNTAGDLHRGQPVGTTRGRTGAWAFLTWDGEAGCFRCAGGNTLQKRQEREAHGQTWTVYRAESPCTGCPLAAECLQHPKAKHRTVHVGQYHGELEAARQRFNEPERQALYRARGPAIETIFGFIAHVLGYRRWSLRGASGTTAEATWIALAYQARKIQSKRVAA
jgi:hypothetical protein